MTGLPSLPYNLEMKSNEISYANKSNIIHIHWTPLSICVNRFNIDLNPLLRPFHMSASKPQFTVQLQNLYKQQSERKYWYNEITDIISNVDHTFVCFT
jgi:hypothetical protein